MSKKKLKKLVRRYSKYLRYLKEYQKYYGECYIQAKCLGNLLSKKEFSKLERLCKKEGINVLIDKKYANLTQYIFFLK